MVIHFELEINLSVHWLYSKIFAFNMQKDISEFVIDITLQYVMKDVKLFL